MAFPDHQDRRFAARRVTVSPARIATGRDRLCVAARHRFP